MIKTIIAVLLLSFVGCSATKDNSIHYQNTPTSTEHYRNYSALILSVYDGDTVTGLFDLGFDISIKRSIRLYKIDAPEIRGPERPKGIISKEYLEQLVEGKTVIVKIPVDERDKYGRILGVILLDELNINNCMIEQNLAVPY